VAEFKCLLFIMKNNSRHHGKKLQEDCLVAIEERMHTFPNESVQSILNTVNENKAVPVRTLRRWYDHFIKYGEYPFETRARYEKLRKLRHKLKRTSTITEEVVQCVQGIVDEHPEFYLDEIQMAVCTRLRVFISQTTLWRVLTVKLDYSLQTCYESAIQQNENERALYQTALDCLVSDANQLVYVDETHKDKQASRRRKAWGHRNSSSGVAVKRWFNNDVRYTMIAALDINGFIPSTIDCVKRNEISSEGAAGTVDGSYFEEWVEYSLCPTLGDYAKGEARSIVVMDNASTHMDGRVAHLIRATGAYILYTAPYSPDLNPIELTFNIYKSQLKRHEREFRCDWYGTHLKALEHINRDMCIKEFRRCGVHASMDILTTHEYEKTVAVLASAFYL